ncbi:MAG TPA: hypothetical protein VGN20_06110 [Mucilaginibacter sp.]
MKILLLFCCLILPLIPPKKRKSSKAVAEQAAKARSDYGVTEDGDITLIIEDDEKSGFMP